VLVARSLERAWEEKLRAVEAIEQAYERWRREEPLVLSEADHAALQALGEDLPRVWCAATTTAADRKRLLRFIIKEVALDQKRERGQVWLKILWQTGTTSEHAIRIASFVDAPEPRMIASSECSQCLILVLPLPHDYPSSSLPLLPQRPAYGRLRFATP